MGWENSEDSTKGLEEVGGGSAFTETRDETFADRRIYTQDARTNGSTKKVTISGIEIETLEATNDEMDSIIEGNKLLGIETTFYTGNAVNSENQKVKGFIVNAKNIYIQYDNPGSNSTANKQSRSISLKRNDT